MNKKISQMFHVEMYVLRKKEKKKISYFTFSFEWSWNDML